MKLDLDKFAHIDSPLRRWDARWKLAAAAVFVTAVILLRTAQTAVPAVVLAGALVLLGRMPLREVLHRVKPAAVVVGVVVMVLAITAPGERVAWAGLSWSRGGLAAGGLVAAKALAVVLALVALVSSSPTRQIWAAMRRLHVPAGLVQVFHLAYRYVFVIQSESRAVQTAMRARGYRAKLNPHNLSVLGNVVGMLLIRSTERAERVYLAMQARGFDGSFPTLEEWRTRGSDIIKFVLLAGASAALVAVDFGLASA
ncbi:MAG TPA: cobalt ECF transporter T component CbiQ [Phycisphaerae bacterium]|nr:cobalt ECF transporter T component CbiQ [Phycisphaerae bacterium]HOJ73436.1 cobalt ECF transporter T component CbiQ [Phycisphaerae bacterium]HOM51045.1 cobalt ECF transporter T component CbiQ [Phycisphaerae bacterium]HOQ85180.1 cobalt ECF transporter T component CbiQ [Phycisphaerae bacterium]HPP25726.1 cobalt ECF transporter T component CbiQ [Phycisphaerae bacterium]